MKNSWKLFWRDIKNISTNWVAMVLIGGLIILPSLYAWFNIKASWDPYGQTEQIPVGVINEDEGATVRGEAIDVGGDLVDELKDNQDMGWQFVDRETAMNEVEYGNYFAAIVIPENFSETLASVISADPEKATVEYYVNEKINAIAPKITEKGASVIVDQISSEFISTVNGVIFDMFNDIGVEIEKELPDIKRFEHYVFTLEEHLPEIHQILEESLEDANHADDIIGKAQKLVPEAKQVTDNGLETIDDTSAFLQDAENRLNEMAPQIENDLNKVQTIASNVDELLGEIQDADIDFSRGEEIKQELDTKIDEAIQQIGTIKELLEKLQTYNASPDVESGGEGYSLSDDKIDQALVKLDRLQSRLEEMRDNTAQIEQFIAEKKQDVAATLADLKQLSAHTSERIDTFVKEYKETIEPRVFKEITKAQSTLAGARDILTEIQTTLPEVEDILARTDNNLGEGKDMLETVMGEFPYISDKVKQLADRIRDVQEETDINEIIELLRNDPEAERSFFEEPVVLNENELFPIENYGTGMTPFYTVLAFWVGAILLISLLSVDVHDAEAFTGREVYFGRFFTFMAIGILQSLIATSGDILLIDVPVKESVWFVVFGLLISFVFMLIVYSLVSVFGDVGKAMAIVLLVLQIAGSGGTYPVVLLPEFFQVINPFLPFTYAVDIMREAVGGIVWERALKDIGFLSLFGLGAIVLGAFLKGPINKQTDKLKKKSEESGLFH